MQARYLRRDEQGRIAESEEELFWRVASAVAEADREFDARADVGRVARRFHDMMTSRCFLPNTPALINAGTDLGQLMACFVLPVPDALDGIFTALRDAAIIQQSGGGTGFSFSRLRPRGDIVMSTRRPSSGPISFMRIFDLISEVIAGESVRGGANMAVLRVDHPDVEAFATAKRNSESLTHFNLSILTPDAFMAAAERGDRYALVNPRTGNASGEVRADLLLDEIAESAWDCGDPGLLFEDRIERDNPTPSLGRLEATNPCGEVPLLPNEACCLGSLNLAAFVVEDTDGVRVDEPGLARMAADAIHFLDNMVEISRYPRLAIEAMCRANRKVGLGIMGLADLLIKLRISYGSRQSIEVASRLAALIQGAALEATRELARQRGPFPNYGISVYAARGEPPRRNATVTTVAPTGSISLLAGCSSGIEPLYALAYQRGGAIARKMPPHPLLLERLEQLGPDALSLVPEIEAAGRIGHLTELPAEVRSVFRVAGEIPPGEHVQMQAAVQQHVENAVSKTVNLPATASPDDVRSVFIEAHRLGCKGITAYRDQSRAGQVFQVLGHCLTCVGEERLPVAAE